MALYPGAIHRLLDLKFLSGLPLTVHNRVNLHVAVSEANSLFGAFSAPAKPSSHFYVRKDGTVEQYVDTALRAEADLDGNDGTISIETQGGVHDPNGEPWTPEQVESLAALYAWAVRTHGVAVRLAEDSKLGASSRGLSTHRLGCDGNFPSLPSPLAGRTQRGGGMHYSTSRGKICPGDAKVLQVPAIFARAQEILADVTLVGSPAPAPAPAPGPTVPQIDVDGAWGADTTRALQRVLGTLVDGILSSQPSNAVTRAIYGGVEFRLRKGGSSVIAALQHVLGIEADGYLGPETIRALQRRLGTPVDGAITRPDSAMVRALQARLNTGTI